MQIHRTTWMFVLGAVAAIGAAQAPPAGSHQRSGYGGADHGSVGTTDDAGHRSKPLGPVSRSRDDNHHAGEQHHTTPRGFQSTNRRGLDNNAKTGEAYHSHPSHARRHHNVRKHRRPARRSGLLNLLGGSHG